MTARIIACAITVHRHLGPGLLEAPYQAAMCLELASHDLAYVCEQLIPLEYRGVRIGEYRPDLIVEQHTVVEIKSVQRYDPVFAAQMLTYLRLTGLHIGLLLNFGRPTMSEGIKRFVL